jgi:hypothetical protein
MREWRRGREIVRAISLHNRNARRLIPLERHVVFLDVDGLFLRSALRPLLFAGPG